MPVRASCQPSCGLRTMTHFPMRRGTFLMLSLHGVHSLTMSSSRIPQQSGLQTTKYAAASGLTPPSTSLRDRLLAQIALSAGPHETITVQAPYTGAAIGAIPAGTVADLELAVTRA